MAVSESGTPPESAEDSAIAASTDERERAAAERWRAAEGRLYPLIVADPDLYTLAVELVVEVRELLRVECASVDALIGAAATNVLSRCGTTAKVRAEGFDPVVAFDAARAARLRELRQS